VPLFYHFLAVSTIKIHQLHNLHQHALSTA